MEKIESHHFGMIVGNMNKDIIEEFMKDHRDALLALDDKERKFVTKNMGNNVMLLLRKNFVNIIDNVF